MVAVAGIPPGGVTVNGEGGVGEGPAVMVGAGGLVGVTRLARTTIFCPTKILLASAAAILFSLRISSAVLLNLEAIPAIVSPGWMV